MPTAKELREKRAEVAKRIQELADLANDEKRDWTAEDEQEWQRVNEEYDALTKRIERQERAERVAADQDEPVGDRRIGRDDFQEPQRPERQDQTPQVTERHRALAFQAWCRHQSGLPVTDEQAEACRLVGLNPAQSHLDVRLAPTEAVEEMAEIFRTRHPDAVRRELERRDLSVGTNASGGYTIPEGFVRSLEHNMLAYGGMLQVASILRTSSGNDLHWPTVDDTANEAVVLAEATQVAAADPTFSEVIFKAYKLTSKMVKISAELLEDSAFDLAAELGRMLGERLGRGQNSYYTTGTGTGQPTGVLNAASLGVTAASGTAITADELLDLIHSIDPAYRTDARFMLHDQTLLAVRKLKDNNGQYIWNTSVAAGEPDRIFGFPYTVNQKMPTIALSAKTVLFGQFRQYKVRQVNRIRLYRLTERYRDYDQEGFVAFMRVDGNLLDAGTDPIKYLQQAAA